MTPAWRAYACHQSREDRGTRVGMPASAGFTAIARRCAAVSGRRGRSLLPNAVPRLELSCWQHGTRLASVCGPPRAAGTSQ